LAKGIRHKPVHISRYQRSSTRRQFSAAEGAYSREQKKKRPAAAARPGRESHDSADETGARIRFRSNQPEARDRVVVRVPVRRHEAHPDVAMRRALDPPDREYPVGMAVDQRRQHYPRVILRRARAAMVDLEGAQIDALDRRDHEVRQIILWDPVPKFGRKQK